MAVEANEAELLHFTAMRLAASVANGMADAGLGVEVPAREFKLEFLPAHQERCFLLCDARSLESADVQRLLATLRGDDFRDAVDRLPGYIADEPGSVVSLDAAFSSFAVPGKRAR